MQPIPPPDHRQQFDADATRSVYGKDNRRYYICCKERKGRFYVAAFCMGKLLRAVSCSAKNEVKKQVLHHGMILRYADVMPDDYR